MFYVVVSVAKSDVSVLCSGLGCQVRCKFFVVVSVGKLDFVVSVCKSVCKFCVVVSVAKSDVSVLCSGLCCQVRC